MTDKTHVEGASPLFDDVADWLMARAVVETPVGELVEGCFQRLHAVGIPLMRAQASFRVLHPLYAATSVTWTPAGGIATEHYPRRANPTNYEASPIAYLTRNNVPYLRRRLTGPEAVVDFPILTELQERGGTDYLAYLAVFDSERQMGVFGSWLTDRPSGFSEADIRGLRRIQNQFAVALKLAIKDEIAKNALRTYLGPDAGAQVLNGQIHLGDVRTIEAAIWYSDLRDSTGLAEAMAPEAFLELLNRYFDVSAGSVIEHGGQVLLLIGDAVLAIFEIGEGKFTAESACAAAWAAAQKARARLAEAESGPHAFEFGIGLHVGRLQFGNIGVPERLQFTVVGPAANQVARLEGLTKTLGRPIIASRAFTEQLGDGPWASLGMKALAGAREPVEVFSPD